MGIGYFYFLFFFLLLMYMYTHLSFKINIGILNDLFFHKKIYEVIRKFHWVSSKIALIYNLLFGELKWLWYFIFPPKDILSIWFLIFCLSITKIINFLKNILFSCLFPQEENSYVQPYAYRHRVIFFCIFVCFKTFSLILLLSFSIS